jgi:hypothetical protein
LSDVLKGLSFLLNCIRIEYSRVAWTPHTDQATDQ